jgi:hypothetical protein
MPEKISTEMIPLARCTGKKVLGLAPPRLQNLL